MPDYLLWSTRVADSLLARSPTLDTRWGYETGVTLRGVWDVWDRTRAPRYWDYIRSNMDHFVQSDGSIATYSRDEYNLDLISQGRLLLPLLLETGDPRYCQAAKTLRDQLRSQPRVADGGFWHKAMYPRQMWLDGIYMASTFLAEYGRTFDEPEACHEAVRQIVLIYSHTVDQTTGLLYHAWDESHSQRWSDPATGHSPHFWSRGIGWYVMALVDVLEVLPPRFKGRSQLKHLLKNTLQAVLRVQDPASGTWYQILNLPSRPGNYLESSASCMFVYALTKGVRLDVLDRAWLAPAVQAYQGILAEFVRVDKNGLVNLTSTCGGAGLGGNPYRDGSFEYYVNEKVVTNDRKGIGPFLMASIELDRASSAPAR